MVEMDMAMEGKETRAQILHQSLIRTTCPIRHERIYPVNQIIRNEYRTTCFRMISGRLLILVISVIGRRAGMVEMDMAMEGNFPAHS
jgi:hypothetical protein